MKNGILTLLIATTFGLSSHARAGTEFTYGKGNCEAKGIKILLLMNDCSNLHRKDPTTRVPALAVLETFDPSFPAPDGYNTSAITGTMNGTDFQGHSKTMHLHVTFAVDPQASRIWAKSKDANDPWETIDLPATCQLKQEGGGSGGAHN